MTTRPRTNKSRRHLITPSPCHLVTPSPWKLRAVLLTACAALPFLTVAPREFTNWDDALHVSHNGAVQYATPANIGMLLSEPVAGNYVPLTMLTYALDWHVWHGRAWGFAATNALVYAGCCLLLVRSLVAGGVSRETAWLAGFLFAVHPAHVEPAAWISGRKDLLCLLWLLATFLAFARWMRCGSRRSYLASVLLLIAAGLSKPAAMSAGIVLWLYAALIGRRPPLKALREVAPHLAVCGLILGGAFWFQSMHEAVRGADDPRFGDVSRAATTLLVDVFRSFVTVPWSPFYPAGLLDQIPAAVGWAALMIVTGLSLGMLIGLQRTDSLRPFALGWFGAVCFLVPVSGIVPLGWTSLADRYLLIPSIASCLLAAWLVRRADHVALTFGIYGLIVCGALLAHVRANSWANSVVLWQTTLDQFPESPLAWKNLTSAYYAAGRLDAAADSALAGVMRVPGDVSLARNAVEILLEQGHLEDAADLLAQARARHADSHELDTAEAKLALHRSQPEIARLLLEQALQTRPDRAEPWLVLSYARQQSHDLEAAIEAAGRSVAAAPSDVELRHRLIELLLAAGRTQAALAALHDATQAVPHSRRLWRLRRDVLLRAGEPQAAAAAIDESAKYIRPPL